MTNQKQQIHPPISGKCESFCTRLSAAIMAENFGDYESALAHWKEACDFAGSSADKHMCELRYKVCRLIVNGIRNSEGVDVVKSELVMMNTVEITLKPNNPAIFKEVVDEPV
ncbi:hypothetical protein [Vibrio alginolyticus]|uniref:hypothetical protein n=1 Tax=Vibrio alginolyticus TaxID=663 RepID=UPI00071EA442|nr:hypothetical protein [Vibrio alginolyticus]ALR94731.1 hypothetical protein AT730_20725 [Vibrio alginolyticus]MBY7706091.1 hypothetical protein [Vibrio alginolyticus]